MTPTTETPETTPAVIAPPAVRPASVKRRVWAQPGFVIAVVILGVSAVGMNAAIAYLDLCIRKLPAPLVKPLSTVPDQLGTWKQVSIDEPLDPEMEEQLATKEYIFRDYVDTSKVDAATMASFDKLSSKERRELAARIQNSNADAVINMAVTYYTGKADTVAHVPERCYVADGYEPKDPLTVEWNMGPGRLGQPKDHPAVPVHYINFEDMTRQDRPTCRVAYFFFTNGNYECDSLRVRQTLQDLSHKHVFYSKIELRMVNRNDQSTQLAMSNFLQSAMPAVEKCYPDWKTIEGIPSK